MALEVQGVLDRNRCPIVQILDDDKGVHIIAAVNLYETVPEASEFGIRVCHELVERQVGCAIGVAMGPTFCGVTGSSSFACRWDITGPPAVRAARLMQFAKARGMEIAVDESLCQSSPLASSRLEALEENVLLKGSTDPVRVYTVSQALVQCGFRILESVFGNVHNDIVNAIKDHIEKRNRSAVVVAGVPVSGKKVVCQRAAGFAGFVPFIHICDQTAGLLQLARTIGDWFAHSDNPEIRSMAEKVVGDMRKSRWSCAYSRCIQLVEHAQREGMDACFVIERIQFLDDFSFSLMRGCLFGGRTSRVSDCSGSESNDIASDTAFSGRICFLCVHTSLYNYKTVSHVVEEITRSRKYSVPVYEVLEAEKEELRRMFRDLSDMEVQDRWLDAYADSSGCCAGYFMKRTTASKELSGELWSQGKPGLAETSEDLVLSIPWGEVRKSRRLKIAQVCPDTSMLLHQVYDDLPPLLQMITKIVAIAAQPNPLITIPKQVVWEVVNDLFSGGVELPTYSIVVSELVAMYYLASDEMEESGEGLSMRCPALADVAVEASTPVQIEAISRGLVERLESVRRSSFRIPLVMAELLHNLGEQEGRKKSLWREAHQSFKRECKGWGQREVDKWKEIMADDIVASGYEVADILPDELQIELSQKPAVSRILPLIKIYSAPVAFGPMGHRYDVSSKEQWHVRYLLIYLTSMFLSAVCQ